MIGRDGRRRMLPVAAAQRQHGLPVRIEVRRGHLGDQFRCDVIDQPQHFIERAKWLVVQRHAGRTIHPRRRAFQRQRDLPFELTLPFRYLSRRQAVGRESRQLVADRRARLDGGLGRCAHVYTVRTGFGMEILERVHRIREAQLLAHALEETRAHAAAQDGVDQHDRIATRVAVRYGRRAEHDVRLRAVARDVAFRRRRWRERRGLEWRGVAVANRCPTGLVENLEQSVVIDVPRRGHHHLRRVVRSRVQLAQLAHAERTHRLAGAQDRIAVGMRAPHRLIVQLEHEIVGRVFHHADFLEHHLALEPQIFGAQQRPEDQIADYVHRLWEVLVEHARLIRRMLARRVGVERSAQHFERERDLARRARPGALEHHVLEEVRDAHALAGFVHRRGAHPGPETDRPYSRHVLREHGQSVGQRRAAQSRVGLSPNRAHRRERPPRRERGRPCDSAPSPPLCGSASLPAPAAAGSRSPPPCGRSLRWRSPRPSLGCSGVPSGFGMSAFMERRRRPRSSLSMSFTRTVSPFLTTSSVFSVRPCWSSEMCTRPSVPGRISTNAPNGVVLLTTASYVAPISGSLVSACTSERAFSIASPPTAAIVTNPVSSTVISAPVSSWMPRMVLPLGPMRSPIFSGLIIRVTMRGAYGERSGRGWASALFISPKMCSRPSRARASASRMILRSRPSILMSIWMDVMPVSVPATLKSMSPKWSSVPRMSVRMA